MSKPNWVFNRHDQTQGIARQLAQGLNARIFAGNQAMLSVVNIDPHSEGKLHSHSQEQWGFLLEGECYRTQDGQEVHVKAGDFWHTPGNVPHSIRTEDQAAVVLDIFAPPRPEYRIAGEGFS